MLRQVLTSLFYFIHQSEKDDRSGGLSEADHKDVKKATDVLIHFLSYYQDLIIRKKRPATG